MPSAIPDPHLRSSSSNSNSISIPSFGPPQSRKSYDRTSIGNAFVWTSDSNGENGHVDSSSDFILKSGSLQSLHTTKASVASSYANASANANANGNSNGGERAHSPLSLETLSIRDRQTPSQNGWMGSDEQHHSRQLRHPLTNGVTEGMTTTTTTTTTTNGDHSGPRSVSSAAPAVGGRSSSDGQVSPGITPQTSMAPSPTRPENSITTNNNYYNYSCAPFTHQNRQPSPSRALQPQSSDPEPPTASSSSAQSPNSPIRPTLQVPKFTPARRNSQSRDPPIATANTNTSEDTLSSDRYSSPTSGLRRASLSLARRVPRSVQSDGHPDEALQDEDAARWTEAIKHRRASKRKRREDEDDERVIVGTKVDQHHVNWVTAYNMLTGIRFTVSRTNAKLDRELNDADFDAKHKFSFDITGNELTPSAKYDFKFKDYAPWVFRHLRARFQLDPADYLVSLTSKYILSELGSPGKSGSFFYFSRDYKYIIKTIHHSEHKLLRRILRDYYHHIENNPNTLISQFYGLHRVKMAYGRKIHFVVMNNLFPPHRDIHHMFDLKGSTIGRDFREDDLDKNPRATLKDLNWLRRTRHLQFGPMKREVFLAQLRRDVALLQKLKIMDYSLLVGIHDVQKGNEEKLRDRTLQIFQPGAELSEDQQSSLLIRTPSRLENARKARELREIIKREKPVPIERTAAKMPDEILDERKNLVFYSDDGGFRATHENGEAGGEIYYLGVIDCLTHYGLLKKAEHFWKGLSHNRNQISPVPPETYGDRFLNFITGITKSEEEAERGTQSQEQAEAQTVDTSQQAAPRSSVDKTMEKAEKATLKSSKTLAEEPEPRERVLSTVRTPASETPGAGGHSTLPVVEEIGENSGAGGEKNGRGETARNGSVSSEQQDGRPHTFRTATGPPGPPPQRLPPPPPVSKPDATPSRGNGKANDAAGNREKTAPSLPNNDHSSIPPMSSHKTPNGYVTSR